MDEIEYEIVYSIKRKLPGKTLREIGFGTSGSSTNIETALYAISSDIQNYGWETAGLQPDPHIIKEEIEG